MKLALDARNIYRRQRRGTGKNLIDLYRHLAELRPQWRLVMFHRNGSPDDPFEDVPNVEHRRVDIKGDRLNLWQQVRLPLAVRAAGADVLHCPANTASRLPGAAMVVTIHDLIPLDARFATPATPAWRRNVAAAARTAKRIITPSEFCRRQITEIFGVPADKITVNPWAADAGCRKVTDPGELSRVRAEFGLHADRPYAMGFAGADQRKNTPGILGAWAKLPAKLRDACMLLLVGGQEPTLTAFRRQAEDLGLAGHCLLHGFARERDMPALISGATFLCYPSRSEGFGLPILDAFACDTPVLTGRVTSLPEVAGDAAVLVDPEDQRSIAAGVAQLLSDDAARAELVARGRERVKQFTWQACARRAADALESALE